MPALNFQKRFVPLVESGEKQHSIRAMRQRPFRVGDDLALYYGQRTKACRLLLRRKVTAVRELRIDEACAIFIDGDALSPDEMDRLAVADGFNSHAEMMTFWDGRRPFLGQIVYWRFVEVRA